MKRSTNGRVGMGQKKSVGDHRQRTPTRKIRHRFHRHKHISLSIFVEVCSESRVAVVHNL